MEEKGMIGPDHPPYSPDLAPSEFYLFRDRKRRLSGTSFGEGGDLCSGIEAILGSIEEST
jgi:hypothetical protein